jgi:hypothetical protein
MVEHAAEACDAGAIEIAEQLGAPPILEDRVVVFRPEADGSVVANRAIVYDSHLA